MKTYNNNESFETVLIRIIKDRFGIILTEKEASNFVSIAQALEFYNSMPSKKIEQIHYKTKSLHNKN